jgi:DNA-binding MarR family transcriptional regulator
LVPTETEQRVDGLEADSLALQLEPRLAKLGWLLRKAASNEFSVTQSAVLGRLSERSYRMTELAAAEGVRVPTMTQIVSRLEEQGWVRRADTAEDRRGVVVSLTGKGGQAVSDAIERRRGFLSGRLISMSPEDRSLLSDALPALDALLPPGF